MMKRLIAMLECAVLAGFLVCVSPLGPAEAQWQVPNYSIPVGRGAGTGFKSIGPCAAGGFPVWTSGAGSNPTCSTSASSLALINGNFNQSISGGMWVDSGTAVNLTRLDRLFVGDMAESGTGSVGGIQGSVANLFTDGAELALREGQLVAASQIGSMSIVGFTRASLGSGVGRVPIGVSGFVINDVASGYGWAGYFDAQRELGSASTSGLEIAVKNKGDNVTWNPYLSTVGGTNGIGLAAGGDNAYGGSAANPSTAGISFSKNAHTWNTGIVFFAQSLTGTDGVTGEGTAVAMAKGHKIAWYYTGSNLGFDITSHVAASTDAQRIYVDSSGLGILNNSALPAFQVAKVAGSITGYLEAAASLSAAPQLSAKGSATNIDLVLVPKGGASVKISQSHVNATPLLLEATDAGANQGPFLILDRVSSSPVAADLLGAIQFRGRNSGGNPSSYVEALVSILNATVGNEDGEFIIRPLVGGVATVAASFSNGMVLGNPTGSYKGTGSANFAADSYVNNNIIYRAGGTDVAVADGGTGFSSYAVGDILYADTISSLAKLADVAIGSVLVSGGVNTAPSWSASPTLTTSLTVPLLIGGTAVGSTLTMKSTTGNGSSDAIIVQVGNNGATEAGRWNTSGQYVANIGSVSAPGIALSGALTTGIFRAAANTGGLSGGGTEVMRWSSAGVNFGSSPSTLAPGTYTNFQIVGTSFEAMYIISTAGVVAQYAANANIEMRIGTVSNHQVSLYANAAQVGSWDASGNFDMNGYFRVGTKIRTAGSAPALSSCGTSPSISGSDLAGEVTMGTGSPTGCVITFNAAYASKPYCTVTWYATPLASQSYAVSTTAITLTQTATSSNKVSYHCIAQSAG